MKKRIAKKPAKKTSEPVPVKSEQRICFGIAWYKTEAEANAADAICRERGYTYNGGWLDGKPCGRDSAWDYDDPVHGRLYACTN